MWQALAMGASIGLGLYSSKTQSDAQTAGTESAARIEAMNREFQKEMFQKDIERQRPFIEAGEPAIERYQETVVGEAGDKSMESGLAVMQKERLTADTGSMSQYVQDLTQRRLEAEEEQAYKGRLLDLQQIGLGAAATAGQRGQQHGRALAGSYQTTGGLLSSNIMQQQANKQNMWLRAADQLSGVPAYMSSLSGGGQAAPAPFTPQSSYGSVQPTLSASPLSSRPMMQQPII